MMPKSWIRAILLASVLSGWFSAGAFAHPASGIVVNAAGEVFFIHTNRGVGKIDTSGRLAYIHEVSGGGHWLALDATGRFALQLPRLFDRLVPSEEGSMLLYASGGAPLVVNRDGNLYYGSGYPDGDDLAPGFHTVTRLYPDGARRLFAPALKSVLEDLNEGVTGLAVTPDGYLIVAGPNALVRVGMDGSATVLAHPIEVVPCDAVFAGEPRTRAFHPPYLRGLAVTEEGTIYAAATGCRGVVKIEPAGSVETILSSERPWTPTGLAVRGGEVYVLEYTNSENAADWVPRVRKLGTDGRVVVLVDLTRDHEDP